MKNIFVKSVLFVLLIVAPNMLCAGITLPAGKYVFVFAEEMNATQVDVFNGIDNESYLSFDSSDPCNAGITKYSVKSYMKSSGLSQLVINLSTSYTKDGGFLHVQIGGKDWKDWQNYAGSPVNVGTYENPVYLVKIASTGTYSWGNDSGELPSCAGGGGGGAGGAGGGAGGETGVGGGEISVSEATGNGTISEAAGCEGCYKTTFVEK